MNPASSLLLGLALLAPAADPPPRTPIRDKTLVAWVRPDAPRDQRGVGLLTLENLPGVFDAIVLGELQPGRWMAGSDFFRRTQPAANQAANPEEQAAPGTPLQIAVAYSGRTVTVYRDAAPYARYEMPSEPVAFDTGSLVLMGLRHYEIQGSETFRGAIDDARIYASALDAPTLAALKPDAPDGPRPLAWWTFDEPQPRDRIGSFPNARLVGPARIENSALVLSGGYLVAGLPTPRTRDQEDWPTYHITARPSEGLCRPYDANGAIYWKGKHHLMYIYQDPARPHGGHSWGHVESTDLVNWTFLPPAVVPEPGDPDRGIFSGNAFLDRDGVPNLCWFGIDAGVCIARAEGDDLVRWKKHPNNPIIPMPKPGQPGHGTYTVWDPYLWLEGDTYYCLLGGNKLPNGKDTLYAMKSPDLVNWTPIGPFYDHPDLSWTTDGEDCSCPDFFRLGDRRVLLCISHKVGARAYVGRFENEHFLPEKHIRMNWPGGHFFAPESYEDGKGRRIVFAWVTDPRTITTQQSTGSGVQSLPRILGLAPDGSLTITPPVELQSLRRDHSRRENLTLHSGPPLMFHDVNGTTLELALEIDPGAATEVGLEVRRSPDGSESTAILYRPADQKLLIDMSRSTKRDDVVYTDGPLDTGGIARADAVKTPRRTVEAPLALLPGEPLRLRVFLDGPMLEVFANDRQCVTQQVFPSREDSQFIGFLSRGAPATLRSLDAWTMAPARFDTRP